MFFLGVSIDALDKTSFKVGYIIIPNIIALVFCARAIFSRYFLLFYGFMGVGLNFSFLALR